MSTHDLDAQNDSQPKDPDLRAALVALKRAALDARKTAIQTDTGIVIQRDGKLVRIPAAELRQSTGGKEET